MAAFFIPTLQGILQAWTTAQSNRLIIRHPSSLKCYLCKGAHKAKSCTSNLKRKKNKPKPFVRCCSKVDSIAQLFSANIFMYIFSPYSASLMTICTIVAQNWRRNRDRESLQELYPSKHLIFSSCTLWICLNTISSYVIFKEIFEFTLKKRY